MKYILIFCISIIIANTIQGKNYIGSLVKGKSKFNSVVKIKKDSTILFAYANEGNRVYAEYEGKIKRFNDTLFQIEAKMSFGQFCKKSNSKDSIYFYIDTLIGKELDVIEIKYPDNTYYQFSAYDSKHKAIPVIKIKNRNYFAEKNNISVTNGRNNLNNIKVTVNARDAINGKFLSFSVPIDSSINFERRDSIDFYVVIKNKVLYSVGDLSAELGKFKGISN